MSKKKKQSAKNAHTKENKKFYIFIVAISITLIIMLAYIITVPQTDPPTTNPTTGENFKFETLDGATIELKDYRGKIVVLDIWATWNELSQYQTTALIPLHINHPDVILLSLNINENETIEHVQQFKDLLESESGDNFNWIFGNAIDSLFPYLDLQGIPSVCIFDKQGEVYFKRTGFTFYEKPPDWQLVTDQSIFDILLKDIINELEDKS